MVTITHEQNIIYSKTHSDGTTREQAIICRQLLSVGHVVGSRPMKRTEKLHQMINSQRFRTRQLDFNVILIQT